jgi:hypothetical protein
MTTAQQRYTWLTDGLTDIPGVSGPDPSSTGFGAAALKVNNRIFAMLSAERLVVKLPQARVEALIGDGIGEPFTAGKDRPMRQWLTLTTADPHTWRSLAREALDFVSGRPRSDPDHDTPTVD